MADQYTHTAKNGPYPSKLQVTLEGGPFHGQIIYDWDEASHGGRWYQIMSRPPYHVGLDLASDRLSALALTVNVRTVRYELKRWNEAGTAGIAECVDDGKPKCKSAWNCAQMMSHWREARTRLKQENSSLEAFVTKTCPACAQALAYEVRPRS